MTLVYRNFPVLVLALLLGLSARAQDIDLIGSVGWDKSGNGIRIHAERVENNRDRGTSGFLRLQIWATDEVYDEVSGITGYVLGKFNLGPLNAGSYFANPHRTVPFLRPPPGIYYTTMTLEEETGDGFVIVDSENFAGAVNFGQFGQGIAKDLAPRDPPDITFVGDVSFLAGSGKVQFFAEQILNERNGGRSGILRLRLFATSVRYEGGGTLQGFPMATKRVGRVDGGFFFQNFSAKASFRSPPSGEYYVTMTLEELVGYAWNIVDYVTFDGPFDGRSLF
jgi:hypothetical protein